MTAPQPTLGGPLAPPTRWHVQGGCEYRVEGVYLWTTGSSWDIIGLANPVYGNAGSFRDEVALETIRAHNQAVRELEAEAGEGAAEDAEPPLPEQPAVVAADQPAGPPAPMGGAAAATRAGA